MVGPTALQKCLILVIAAQSGPTRVQQIVAIGSKNKAVLGLVTATIILSLNTDIEAFLGLRYAFAIPSEFDFQ